MKLKDDSWLLSSFFLFLLFLSSVAYLSISIFFHFSLICSPSGIASILWTIFIFVTNGYWIHVIYFFAIYSFSSESMMLTFLICHMVGVSSSITNPILYGFLNNNFVKEFRIIFTILTKWIGRNVNWNKSDVWNISEIEKACVESSMIFWASKVQTCVGSTDWEANKLNFKYTSFRVVLISKPTIFCMAGFRNWKVCVCICM